MAGFCLSSYMDVVIPVVAMLMGRGLLVGVDRSLTPPLDDDKDEPGLAPALAVEFSLEMPRIERGKVSRRYEATHSQDWSLSTTDIYLHKNYFPITPSFRQNMLNICSIGVENKYP